MKGGILRWEREEKALKPNLSGPVYMHITQIFVTRHHPEEAKTYIRSQIYNS